MKRINTGPIAPNIAYPFSEKGLDFLQDSFKEMLAALALTFAGDNTTGGQAFALVGCKKIALGGGNFRFTFGYIYDQVTQEIYLFPGINSIAIPTAAVLTITTTADPVADPTTFSDGTPHSVHDNRKLIVSNGALGSADINYDDLVFLQNEDWHYVGDTGEPAFKNSWNNQSGSPGDPGTLRYRKDKNGVVHIAFELLAAPASGGTDTTAVVFTFPAGYLPENGYTFATTYNTGTATQKDCMLKVDKTTGDVYFIRLNAANFGGTTQFMGPVETPMYLGA